MGYYINQNAIYYEGDRASPQDQAVPPRPDARHGWIGSTWVLEHSVAIAICLADINTECEKAIAAIRAGYPESEVLSWPKQEAEARAVAADHTSSTPLLDALATARGIDKAELVARVIAKADAFAAISGALIGKRQNLEDQLDALPVDATAEQVAAIVW